jgi:hypothetical protein
LLKQNPLTDHSVPLPIPFVLIRRATAKPISTRIPDSEDGFDSSTSFETCIEQKHRAISTSKVNSSPDITSPSCIRPEKFLDGVINEYDNPCSARQTPEFKTVFPTCSHETMQELINENVSLRKKLSDMAEKCNRLDHNERLKNSLQVFRPLGLEQRIKDLEDRMKRQNQEILDLRLQRKNLKPFRLFLEPDSSRRVENNMERIKDCHGQMERSLESLSIRSNYQQSAWNMESRDLSELKYRALGNWSYDGSDPVGRLVQSLTGAAVCDWVFHTKFQCVDMMNTMILEAYRELLRASGKCPESPPFCMMFKG